MDVRQLRYFPRIAQLGGFGYSALPKSAVHMELMQGDLWGVPIPELALPAALMPLKVAQRPLSLACHELQRLLMEEVAKLAQASWGQRERPRRPRAKTAPKARG
ncbi:MAG: hypothetical protein EXQ92_10955 [Alphaproteobacteria bacterium]|nr:hypothetical protein [Alphaproteobacteria bacterium]